MGLKVNVWGICEQLVPIDGVGLVTIGCGEEPAIIWIPFSPILEYGLKVDQGEFPDDVIGVPGRYISLSK